MLNNPRLRFQPPNYNLMRKGIFLLLLSSTFSLFCRAQCTVTVKPNGPGLTSYTVDRVTVANGFKNKVAISMNGVVDQNKKGYVFDLKIATIANEKVSITPNYLKFKFANGSSIEFTRDVIKTTVKDHLKTQEVHFFLSDAKLKSFSKMPITEIRIVDASAHVFKIGKLQSTAVKTVTACIMKSSTSKSVKLVNLTI